MISMVSGAGATNAAKGRRNRYVAFADGAADGDAFDEYADQHAAPNHGSRGRRNRYTSFADTAADDAFDEYLGREAVRNIESRTQGIGEPSNASAPPSHDIELKTVPDMAAAAASSSEQPAAEDGLSHEPPQRCSPLWLYCILLIAAGGTVLGVRNKTAWPRASRPPPTPPPSPAPLPPPPPLAPPHPPHAPIPLNAAAKVELLNARFAAGHPSDDVLAAGIMLHTFDAMDDGRDDVWNACPEEAWCGRYNDRWSVSIVNRRTPSFFRGSGKEPGNQPNGGFVLDSSTLRPVASSILCAWAVDGGTLQTVCKWAEHGCIPGCREHYDCEGRDNMGDYCWFRANRLEQMMKVQERLLPTRTRGTCNEDDCRYNEVVISAEAWAHRVPELIAAVYYPNGSLPGRARARAVHCALIRSFPQLNSATGPPLVRYDGLANPAGPAFALEQRCPCDC